MSNHYVIHLKLVWHCMSAVTELFLFFLMFKDILRAYLILDTEPNMQDTSHPPTGLYRARLVIDFSQEVPPKHKQLAGHRRGTLRRSDTSIQSPRRCPNTAARPKGGVSRNNLSADKKDGTSLTCPGPCELILSGIIYKMFWKECLPPKYLLHLLLWVRIFYIRGFKPFHFRLRCILKH